jgi:hypothetical protein
MSVDFMTDDSIYPDMPGSVAKFGMPSDSFANLDFGGHASVLSNSNGGFWISYEIGIARSLCARCH